MAAVELEGACQHAAPGAQPTGRPGLFVRALRESNCIGASVLDVGSKPGMLAMLARVAGATRTAVVMRGEGATSRAVESDISVSSLDDLPTGSRFDFVATDDFGAFVVDSSVLATLRYASEKHLLPDGHRLPERFTLQLTPVASDELASIVGEWMNPFAEPNFSDFAEAAANSLHRVRAGRDDALSPTAAITSFDSDHDAYIGGSVTFHVERPGTCCGLIGTWIAHLTSNVTLTNSPWGSNPVPHDQCFLPFAAAIAVEPGDSIRATLHVAPKSRTVAWRCDIVDAAGVSLARFEHDTLQGAGTSPHDLLRLANNARPPRDDRFEIAIELLALVNGVSSFSELAHAMAASHPEAFSDRDQALTFVRSVLAPLIP